MKAAHLITGLETGGAEMMLYKLVSRMDRRKFDGIVISLMGRGRMAEQVETAGTRIVTLGMRRVYRTLLQCCGSSSFYVPNVPRSS